VAPGGSVLRVDVSASMLGMAQERAAREGATNIELRVADAETLERVPVGHFDVTLARWGLMYRSAPVAALSAARRRSSVCSARSGKWEGSPLGPDRERARP
jgi:ubiquinone/menaquinone biosynthesis C-methylase UbiE